MLLKTSLSIISQIRDCILSALPICIFIVEFDSWLNIVAMFRQNVFGKHWIPH